MNIVFCVSKETWMIFIVMSTYELVNSETPAVQKSAEKSCDFFFQFTLRLVATQMEQYIYIFHSYTDRIFYPLYKGRKKIWSNLLHRLLKQFILSKASLFDCCITKEIAFLHLGVTCLRRRISIPFDSTRKPFLFFFIIAGCQ